MATGQALFGANGTSLWVMGAQFKKNRKMHMPKRKSRKNGKPGYWERGHKSHHYWSANGSKKLGTIDVVPTGEIIDNKHYFNPNVLYRWSCGHNAGEAETLKKARIAVELAHITGQVQMSFFDLAGNITSNA
jgi:hypothetical protein